MRKRIPVLVAGFVSIAMMAACGKEKTEEYSIEYGTAAATDISQSEVAAIEAPEEALPGEKDIDKLTVCFVPSHDPAETIKSTEPLKGLLINELSKEGYNVKSVEITVGSTYESVGEALTAGTVDVGFVPAGTYVMYDEGCDVILTATRDGLSLDSEDPRDWNENKPTERTTEQSTYYRGLVIAGPSKGGRKIAEKVNEGQEIAWEDLDALKWSVMDSSSPAGFVYPSLWIQQTFNMHITDVTYAEVSDNYDTAFSKLAAGKIDILVTYADARLDQEEKWTNSYGRTSSIWDETDVIGVTAGIYNDTVCVSKTSPIMSDELKEAITKALINIGNTDEGKEAVSIYNHKGYTRASTEDYDSERAAQKMMMSMN